jgi:hypothetical protein
MWTARFGRGFGPVVRQTAKWMKYLPLKIKKLDNFNRFRKKVKLASLKNSFYMLEEFLQVKSVQ